MKTPKKILAAIALCFSLSSPAFAGGIPVIDAANLANTLENLVQWGKQLQAMKEQYEQQVQQYNSLNGARGMANLVNNPALRKYLPANYQDILNNGYGNWESIRNSAKVIDLADTHMKNTSATGKAFEANANQAAINRATYEDAYSKANNRFDDIQTLLDKVNNAPDAKDIADLQARIQAEQVMMQNEQIKLSMLTQLAQAQKDLAEQATKERRIKFTKGDRSTGAW